MKTSETLLTVDGADLIGLLADLRRTASDDCTLPMINGVHLHVAHRDGQTFLVGTSTNRYILGQAHVPASGDMPETFIPGESLGQLLSIAPRSLRKGGSLCEVRTRAGLVTIAVAALPGLSNLSLTVEARPEKDFAKRTHQMLAPEPGDPTDEFDVDHRWLSVFVQIARSRRENLRLRVVGVNKQVIVQIGDRFQGALMPRRAAKHYPVPVFTLPREQEQEVKAA